MSASILEASEENRLKWLAEIYEFEYNTIQSKTTGLTEQDLQSVKNHLSKVFSTQAAEIVIESFYSYNEQEKFFFVPDSDWFSYNKRWPTKQLSIIESTDKSAVLELTGVDDYYGANQKIHIYLEIEDGTLRVQKRVYYN